MVDRREQTIPFLVAALAGVVATLLGLADLHDGNAAFSLGGVASAIGSQLARTGPAGALVLVAAAANVAMGAGILRIASRRPFASVAELIVHGLAAAVLADTVLLLSLGSVGAFRWPVLAGLHVLVLLAAWRWARPWFSNPIRLRVTSAWPLGLLVLLVWSAPVVLQLASPVVPFADVLPNHVAPVEHIRTFGSFQELTTMPSSIYGPSRSFLGYNGLLGALSAMTRVEAAQAVGAFALPLVIVLSAAAVHVARMLFGDRAVPWLLLTVPLTIVFLRLSDLRSSVIAVPVAAAAMALSTTPAARTLRLAVLVTAAIMLHPLIGALAVTAIASVVVLDATRRATIVASFAAALVAAIPQVLTTLNVAAPSWSALAAIPAAIGVGVGVTRLHIPPLRRARPVLVAITVTIVIGCLRFASELAGGARETFGEVMRFPLLAIAGSCGFVVGASGRQRRILAAAIVVPLAIASAVRVAPSGPALWGSGRWEVISKTVEFWVPFVLAVMAAAALAALWERRALAWKVVVVAFVVVCAFPLAERVVELAPREEARYAESIAIAFHHAEEGFWKGYPDRRLLVDPPRRDLIDVIRAEQDAGRLGPRAEVLHVADSFQQWSATPLAVFTGVMETSVSHDPERSPHTVGGRLHHLDELASLLEKRFEYVVLEGDVRTRFLEEVEAARYRTIYQNLRSTVLVRI